MRGVNTGAVQTWAQDTWRTVAAETARRYPAVLGQPVIGPRTWAARVVLADAGQVTDFLNKMAPVLEHRLAIQGVRVAQETGILSVQVPLPEWAWYDVWACRLPSRRGLAVCVGVDVWLRPVWLDFGRWPHLAVAGATNSGKTELLRTLVAKLHGPGTRQVILDTKGTERPFAMLRGTAGVDVVDDPQVALRVVRALAHTLRRDGRTGRDSAARPLDCHVPGQAGVRASAHLRRNIFLVVDDLPGLVRRCPSISEPLAQMAADSRAAGGHLIVAAQDVTKANTGDMLIIRNVPARFVGLTDSPQTSAILGGRKALGADRLVGPGDFVAKVGPDTMRVFVARTTEAELAALPRGEPPALPAADLLRSPDELAGEEPEGDGLGALAERARPVWERYRDGNGRLRWGGKAAIAEALFGERTTAGHYGRVVDRVIQHLEKTTTTTGPVRADTR